MQKLTTLAAGKDLSDGFKDFFDTIGMTGAGLVFKSVAAVVAIIALFIGFGAVGNDPKRALRKGGMAVGTLLFAVVLAMYGAEMFATITES
ncbi:hypothetical protein [Streptomyces sp. 049-1]|uniref:hypothetical protein n=1 Tax=Streptomyces sp. 049-1 TaxID=2789264 RepID=UPI00397F6691